MKSKPITVRKGSTGWWVDVGSFAPGHYGLRQCCKSWDEAMAVANAEAPHLEVRTKIARQSYEAHQQIDRMRGI